MSKMIKRLGHRVATAENGQIALDLITAAQNRVEGATPVEVVFLDK
jgi:CheY-like chemotaxis protein